MKVTYGKVSAVAVWKWTVNDDTCGICRNPFDGPCAKCQDPQFGEECNLARAHRFVFLLLLLLLVRPLNFVQFRQLAAKSAAMHFTCIA